MANKNKTIGRRQQWRSLKSPAMCCGYSLRILRAETAARRRSLKVSAVKKYTKSDSCKYENVVLLSMASQLFFQLVLFFVGQKSFLVAYYGSWPAVGTVAR